MKDGKQRRERRRRCHIHSDDISGAHSTSVPLNHQHQTKIFDTVNCISTSITTCSFSYADVSELFPAAAAAAGGCEKLLGGSIFEHCSTWKCERLRR